MKTGSSVLLHAVYYTVYIFSISPWKKIEENHAQASLECNLSQYGGYRDLTKLNWKTEYKI